MLAQITYSDADTNRIEFVSAQGTLEQVIAEAEQVDVDAWHYGITVTSEGRGTIHHIPANADSPLRK